MALTFEEAAHLLRRMGFGGNPDEIDNLAQKGSREAAVDYLINYETIDNSAMNSLLARSFDFSAPNDNQRFNDNEVRRWWVTRMVSTQRQFQEKMTLFWHNHFATAVSKVGDILIFVQNDQVLRPFALARFDTLLLKVAQDPAMLVWLDGITNVRGRANENWARELQELFTMGITDVVTGQQNYTEDDVQEIARAFTGWKFRRPNAQDLLTYQFFVNANEHDNGSKNVYGQTANYSGEDILTIVAAKRATGRYLVKKLFDFFVYPIQNTTADRLTVEKFADVYISSDHSIKQVVRAIFTSEEFFSERARFALIKQPIELVIGAVRMLGATYNPGTFQQRDGNLYSRSRVMGQDLCEPRDVAGWDLNLGWIDTASMLERYNYANALITNRPANPANPGSFVTLAQLKNYTKKNAKKTVKKLLEVLGPLEVEKPVLKQLMAYLQTNDQGLSVPFVGDDATIDKKVRGLVHQIMSLPQFQLN